MGDLTSAGTGREPAWRRYLRFWGARVEADVDDELAFHVESRTAEYVALGMDRDAARRRALAQFGDMNRYREETRAIDNSDLRRRTVAEFLGGVREDVRFATRQIRRKRSLGFAAVSCLALGIGASTAIFSVVNAVLFRPLPFAQPERLVLVSEGWSQIAPDLHRIASPNIVDFEAARGRAFESLALAQGWSGTIVHDGDAELVPGAQVTPSFFEVLAVRPAIGRPFEAGDVTTGAPLVTILSDGYWRRRYAADLHIVGKTIAFASGRSAEIVGVMPPSFRFPFAALEMPTGDMLMPLYITPEMAAYRGNSYDGTAIGRLRHGVTVRDAEAALRDIVRQFPTRYPDTYGKMAEIGGRHFVHVTPLGTAVHGDVRRQLLLLLGAVGFLLLVACINVASLFVARTAARRREFDVRRALGATRGRLAQQLFAEAFLLVVAAGILGLLLGWWGAKALVAAAPSEFYRSFDIAVDWRVTAAVLGVMLATSFAFALLPPSAGGRLDSLGDNERAATAAPVRSRARRVLIVSEIALALVLTIGAGLMIRSFAKARAVDPGFDPAGVMTFRISLPLTRYRDSDRLKATELQLLEQFRRMPGVRAASAGRPLPMTEGWQITFTPEGPPQAKLPLATNAFVLPGFLETMRVRLQTGRTFTVHDDANAPPVVIVNETLARRYFGGNALGHRLKWGTGPSPDRWMTVIGVVGDVKHDGLDAASQPSVYMPVLQQDSGTVSMYRFLSYVVRLDGGSAPTMRAFRDAAHDVDPQLAMVAATSMEALVGRSIVDRRFHTLLLGLFSALALILAATGVYGLLQYSVLQRTREIGIRVAIGARRANVMQLVIGEAMRLTAIGVALGVAGALALTRVMRSLLFATSPLDLLSFAVAAALLLIVALAASYLPTRRALCIDPATAMRGD